MAKPEERTFLGAMEPRKRVPGFSDLPVHLRRSFQKPCRRCIKAPPYQFMPSPGSRRRLVAGDRVQELRVLPQETMYPGAPLAVVPWARSSPEVGSQVQGG